MSFTLSNGAHLPEIGLGTFLSKKNEVENAVEYAIRNGYRHLDLARVYSNQLEVGTALKKVIPSVVKREELFITTKLWNTSHHPSDVEKEFDQSLKQLGIEFIDLYLMHWPIALKPRSTTIDTSVTVAETWEAMNGLLKTGKVKAIGVSNFTASHLKELIAATGIKPAVNQVELHPYLHQDDLLKYAKREGIHLTAYFPIGGQAVKGRPSLLDDSTVKELAVKYNATAAQVLLAWGLSRGYSVIPKSVTPARIKSNLVKVTLSAEDLQRVGDIGKGKQLRFVTPSIFGWDINLFGTEEELNKRGPALITAKANM